MKTRQFRSGERYSLKDQLSSEELFLLDIIKGSKRKKIKDMVEDSIPDTDFY